MHKMRHQYGNVFQSMTQRRKGDRKHVQAVIKVHSEQLFRHERREILIRDGKGSKDRVTMLPRGVVGSLHEQLASAREQHMLDLRDGFGNVWLPFAVARKFPTAGREWGWQFVFPADRRSHDPRTDAVRRHQALFR